MWQSFSLPLCSYNARSTCGGQLQHVVELCVRGCFWKSAKKKERLWTAWPKKKMSEKKSACVLVGWVTFGYPNQWRTIAAFSLLRTNDGPAAFSEVGSRTASCSLFQPSESNSSSRRREAPNFLANFWWPDTEYMAWFSNVETPADEAVHHLLKFSMKSKRMEIWEEGLAKSKETLFRLLTQICDTLSLA